MIKGDILIVDDELQALKLLEYTLRKAFNVKAASSGQEALDILNEGFKPGVIITDLMMPGMYGTELLRRAIDIVPDATRVIITAHESTKEIIAAINQSHAYMYLKKPWDNLEIFQAAVIAYDKYESKVFKDNSLRDSQSIATDTDQTIQVLNEANLYDENKRLANENYKKQQDFNELESKLKILNTENDELEKKLIGSRQEVTELQHDLEIKKVRIEALERKALALSEEIQANESFSNDSALALSAYIRESESYWFTDHTYNISLIVKALVNKMELPNDMKEDTITSALLHNLPIYPMPDTLKYADPNNLTPQQRDRYMQYFTRVYKIFGKVKRLNRYSAIISQIWEHFDGSGYPNGLASNRIKPESQIIALANIYHTNVYGLPIERYQELILNGQILQTKAEHDIRHKEAIKSFFKRTSWFDKDIFQAFMDLVQEKTCSSLIPNKENLVIYYDKTLSIKNQLIHNGNSISESYDAELKMDTEKLVNTINFEPVEIEPSDVKAGMMVVENIRTVNGITIVKAETELTPDHVKKIKQFDMKNTILGKIIVLLPKHEV